MLYLKKNIFPYLIHENIKDARGNRQREEGEEKSEEPGRGVHGCVKTLRSKMDVQLGKLLLKKIHFNANLKRHRETCTSPSKQRNRHPLVDRNDTAALMLRRSPPSLPGADTQTGRCRDPAQPYWAWTVPSDDTPASDAQTHKRPPLLASARRTDNVQTLEKVSFVHVIDKTMSIWVIVSDITCFFQQIAFNPRQKFGFLGPLPALAADQQWKHFLDSIPPLDPPESRPEEYTHIKNIKLVIFLHIHYFYWHWAWLYKHERNMELIQLYNTIFWNNKMCIRLNWTSEPSSPVFDIWESV